MRASSSFSARMMSFLRSIWSMFALDTSLRSSRPARRFSCSSRSSSSFMRSISDSICRRSWSRSSSWRWRSAARSSICSLSTLAPSRRSAARFTSRSSYSSKALMRSISIIKSRRRSSSSFSSRKCLRSSICASRIVTHLLYSIIWFMRFTSSSSSSSIPCARLSVERSALIFSCSVSDGGTRFFRSSSIASIFSLRALLTARSRSFAAFFSALIAEISSAVRIDVGAFIL
mmetsp:Transcript_9060/g.29763  ORF Transcript_9060/g.29763 Transcript_9060/m.29763 type:complete len:231 (+) Transcript_9060:228-920(+)